MFKELNTLAIFLRSPNKEFNVREAARLLKIAPATASKELQKFAKQEILTEKKERGFNLYKANLESDLYRDIKVFYNLRSIKESGLIQALNSFYLKPAIVLFGSASQGLDVETSDFDMVIISEKTAKFSNLEKFEKKIGRRLQLFAVKNLKELKNEHLINNVANGIVIQGEIKWT